jgi:hypothetical protein
MFSSSSLVLFKISSFLWSSKDTLQSIYDWYISRIPSKYDKEIELLGVIEMFKRSIRHKDSECLRYLCTTFKVFFPKNSVDYAISQGDIEILNICREFYDKELGSYSISREAIYKAFAKNHFEMIKYLQVNNLFKIDSDLFDYAFISGSIELVRYLETFTKFAITEYGFRMLLNSRNKELIRYVIDKIDPRQVEEYIIQTCLESGDAWLLNLYCKTITFPKNGIDVTAAIKAGNIGMIKGIDEAGYMIISRDYIDTAVNEGTVESLIWIRKKFGKDCFNEEMFCRMLKRRLDISTYAFTLLLKLEKTSSIRYLLASLEGGHDYYLRHLITTNENIINHESVIHHFDNFPQNTSIYVYDILLSYRKKFTIDNMLTNRYDMLEWGFRNNIIKSEDIIHWNVFISNDENQLDWCWNILKTRPRNEDILELIREGKISNLRWLANHGVKFIKTEEVKKALEIAKNKGFVHLIGLSASWDEK